MKCRRTGKADGEASLLSADIASCRLDRQIDVVQDGPRPLHESTASVRQFDASRQAPEERRADDRLQLGDLLAERRLLDAEPFGGTGHVPLIGNGNGIAQVSKLDHGISHRYG